MDYFDIAEQVRIDRRRRERQRFRARHAHDPQHADDPALEEDDMNETTTKHPLRALLDQQGRSVSWLAALLGCNRRVMYDRLSGRRPGNGSRGPAAWTPAPVRVVQAAHDLNVRPSVLAGWLGVRMGAGDAE